MLGQSKVKKKKTLYVVEIEPLSLAALTIVSPEAFPMSQLCNMIGLAVRKKETFLASNLKLLIRLYT